MPLDYKAFYRLRLFTVVDDLESIAALKMKESVLAKPRLLPHCITAFWNRWTLGLDLGLGNAGPWTDISGNIGPKTHKICCIHV